MPGRLLNFVSRKTRSSEGHSSSSSSSSASSINECIVPAPTPKKERVPSYRQRLSNPSSRSRASFSPERPSSFTMDHLLNLAKDKENHRDNHRKEKRNSLSINVKRASSGSRDRLASPRNSSPKLKLVLPAKMEAEIESPPLVFFGNTANSTGALLSGRLKLNVTDPQVVIQTFRMDLQAVIVVKKPVEKNCKDCSTQKTIIKSWEFITEPLKLQTGVHDYPFSHLLSGNLPATTQSHLANIEYYLVAKAHTNHSEDIVFRQQLKVQRAIMAGPDKTSVRIFPPTNLTARVVLPPVVHPIGQFPIQMILSGVMDKSKDIVHRWKLRKLNWKIEEHQKVVSPACKKHSAKLGGEGKGVQHSNQRNIGSDELRDGWKTDFDTIGGEITLEFPACINPNSSPVCDVDSPTGVEVSHILVMELIVAEEYSTKSARVFTPTGAARVLRMQFKVFVTERPGLGISWDEEMPPVYSEVPVSPPIYHNTTTEDYGGPPLEYEELDRLDRRSPTLAAARDRPSPGQNGLGRISSETVSSPFQLPIRPRFDVDDLETAPVLQERRPDETPLDPEDRL